MAQRAKRPCRKSGCPELVDSGYCAAHTSSSQRVIHDRYRGTAASRGYDAAWKRVRLLALKRDRWLCQMCLKVGRVSPATDVDHIIPITEAPHLRLDLDNLQSLDRQCHRIKTEEDLKRVRNT